MDIEQFRLFLLTEQKGKKRLRGKRTVDLHLSLLRRISRDSKSLSPDDISTFLLSLFEQGRKGTYLNDFVDTLHIYGRFLKTNLYETLKYFPEEDYEKATMSDEEIEKFLALPCTVLTRRDTRTPAAPLITYAIGKERYLKMQMFWKCLAYSGARPGEIAALKITDVDFGRQVFCVDGKTGKRLVPIAQHLIPELTAYIERLDTEYLFPSTSGRNNYRHHTPTISDVDWGYDFHSRLKKLGIKRTNLTPYSLRHSFITRMLDEDVNLYSVQNVVGHKQGSPVTSQYYHLSTKRLIKTINSDPLGRAVMSYDERFHQFRSIVRLTLGNYAMSLIEEKQMIKDLLESVI